jgi:hypothetical protein
MTTRSLPLPLLVIASVALALAPLGGGDPARAQVGKDLIDQAKKLKPHYEYEQSTGNFYLVQNGQRTLLEKGYSGTGEGRNNPDKQAEKSVGPIPRGRYGIGKPHDSAKTGKYVMDLTPVGHDAEKRTAFQIHGNNAKNDASHGCIILGKSTREVIGTGGVTTLEVVRGPAVKRDKK